MRCWCSSRLASSWLDALAHGDQLVLGHQLGDRLPRIGGEAHVAVGEDADQLAGAGRCRRPRPPECRRCCAPSSARAHRRASRRGSMVSGFTTMPDSNLLTWRTCSACSSGSRLRWMTPMPPACAMAIAILASVTVSMAEATIGMLSAIARVMRVRISTSDGSTSDRPGLSSTSSKVSASGNANCRSRPSPTPVRPDCTGSCGPQIGKIGRFARTCASSPEFGARFWVGDGG